MRRLPSRAVKVKRNDSSTENALPKAKIKKSPMKVKRQTRRALADKTNSASDHSTSTSSVVERKSRPVRTLNVPSKFADHEVNVYGKPKQKTDKKTQNKSSKIKTNPINGSKSITRSKTDVKRTTLTKKTTDKSSIVNTKSTNLTKPKLDKQDKKISLIKSPIKQANKSSPKKSLPVEVITKPMPVYKNQSILIDSDEFDSDKMNIYEFKAAPKPPEPKIKKKRIVKKDKAVIKKDKVVRKKKMLSESAYQRAMQMLLEDIKKIQAAKKFREIKAQRQFDKLLNVPQLEAPAAELPESDLDDDRAPSPFIHDQPPSPIADDRPPSPIVTERPKRMSFHFESDEPISVIANNTANKCDSPWRLDLDTAKKWRYNFPVKTSMTPAYERDSVHTIGFGEKCGRVKGYGNMLDLLTSTPVYDNERNNNATKLKQTSILSFYENKFNKSPRKRASPSKNIAVSLDFQLDDIPPEPEAPNIEETAEEPQIAEQNQPQSADECFGFEEDIMEVDTENLHKAKKLHTKSIKLLKNRKRGILKEVNLNSGPARLTPGEIQNIIQAQRVEHQEKDDQPTVEFNTSSPSDHSEHAAENESQNESLALFEDPKDVELVHSIKPARKSYERRKRPAVRFKEVADYVTDGELSEAEIEAEKFTYRKKTTKKKPAKQMTKKQAKEASEWANQFNSLLQEAEDYELCVE